MAQVQQYIRSEQDTNPVVSDSIQTQFQDKAELLQLTERLGELKFRKVPVYAKCMHGSAQGSHIYGVMNVQLKMVPLTNFIYICLCQNVCRF